MNKLHKLVGKIFYNSDDENSDSALFVSVDDLISMRKYVAYLKAFKNRFQASNQAGDVKSAFKGRGIEMEEIRAYNYGDDVRDIDWRVTARKDNPYTKLYAEEKDREIYVLLDLSADMAFGTRHELKSVAAAKITAMLGWLALENKDRFGCVIFDGENNYVFKPQNHQAAMLAILKKISELSKSILENKDYRPANLGKSLQLFQQSLKNRATIFIVSGFEEFEEVLRPQLAALGHKARLYMVNVFDVLEEIAPLSGEYMVQDKNQSLIFDSDSLRFKEAYQEYFAIKREKIRDFCKKFACHYMEVRTDLPLYKQIKI